MEQKKLEPVKVTTFAEYQKAAMRTCTESSRNPEYMILEIISEVGEVVGKVAKIIRDDGGKLADERREEIVKELGDVMWGVAGCFYVKNLPLVISIIDDSICSVNNIASSFVEESKKKDFDLFPTTMSLMTVVGDFVNSLSNDDIPQGPIFYKIILSVAIFANMIDSSLQEVCQCNIDKLADRWNRNQIHRSGDNR